MSHVTDTEDQDTLTNLLVGVMTGSIRTHELPPVVLALMRVATEPLHRRIADLEHENNRLYFEMSRRPAAAEPTGSADYTTYADLSDIRGDHGRAVRHRARMSALTYEGAA